MTTDYLQKLFSEIPTEIPENEGWYEFINRIKDTTRPHLCRHEHFDYFLGVLPPRWMGLGAFAFAEGEDNYMIFVSGYGQPMVRSLTWEETQEFLNNV